MTETLQTQFHDDTVFSHNGNGIGNRSNGHHLQKVSEDILSTGVAEKRLHKFEHHPNRSKILVRIAAIGSLRIQDRPGIRQGLIRQMMICNNEIQPQVTR